MKVMIHALPNAQPYHEHHCRLQLLNVPTCQHPALLLQLLLRLRSLSHPFSPALARILFLNILFLVPVSSKCLSFLAHSPHQTCCSISNLKYSQRSLPQIPFDYKRSIALLPLIVKHHRAALLPASFSSPVTYPNQAFILSISSKRRL